VPTAPAIATHAPTHVFGSQLFTGLFSQSSFSGFNPNHVVAVGDRITVREALTALLVKSANDAALTLAAYVAGSEKKYVKLMNRRARELGVDEHAVVKTLVMQDEQAQPLMVLMHGDRQVSTKALARAIGVKSVEPCTPEAAQRHSGYLVGGTSPFGTKKAMRVYVEAGVLTLPRIFINGGRRGYLVGLSPAVLVDHLQARPGACALG
jgi:Cys-tRNA(Pro) deacylase